MSLDRRDSPSIFEPGLVLVSGIKKVDRRNFTEDLYNLVL